MNQQLAMQDKLRVLAVIADQKQGSIAEYAAQCMLEGAVDQGADVQIVTLREWFWVCDKSEDQATISIGEQVLRNQMSHADAFVFASSETNNIHINLMKPALENLQHSVMAGKPSACIGTGTGVTGGITAMQFLMTELTSKGVYTLPHGVFINERSVAISSTGFEHFHRNTFNRLRSLVTELMFGVFQLRSA